MKFLHVGDVHIGKERLDGRLPSSDFSAAFNQAVDAAIAEKVDFVLVAGDFFDKSRIEPNHLSEGEEGLRRLHAAAIPVVAIEGNHDIVSSWDPRPSWLSYLNGAGLLRLLRTEFRDGHPLMKEWTAADPRGNWLDLAGARIVGAGWFGASTARRIELLAPALEERDFTILMLHAGVMGQADEFGMVDRAALEPLRKRVDYLALGHIHRANSIDGWIHNAGAMEHWDLEEAKYRDEKGYLLVDVRKGRARARLHPVRRRPVLRASVDCTRCAGVAAIVDRVRAEAVAWSVPSDGVVQVTLWGTPEFDDAVLSPAELRAVIEAVVPCRVADVLLRLGRRPGADLHDAPEALRDEIVREEIDKLIRERGLYEDHVELVRSIVLGLLADRTDEEHFLDVLARARPYIEKTHANPEAPAPQR